MPYSDEDLFLYELLPEIFPLHEHLKYDVASYSVDETIASEPKNRPKRTRSKPELSCSPSKEISIMKKQEEQTSLQDINVRLKEELQTTNVELQRLRAENRSLIQRLEAQHVKEEALGGAKKIQSLLKRGDFSR